MMIDAELLGRLAASCMIDMWCQTSPLHAALRDEGRVNDWLFDAYVRSFDAAIFEAYEQSTARLLDLLQRFER